MMSGQQSLSNFFESIKFSHPFLAMDMEDDIMKVTLYALSADKTNGQDAAERLRRQAQNLSEVLNRLLGFALIDLGFK